MKEDIEKMIALYEEGKSLGTVGKLHNLSRERIRQLFERAGHKRRKRTNDKSLVRVKWGFKASREDLVNLYWNRKFTMQQIADHYFVSLTVICKLFARYDIPARTREQVIALRRSKFSGLLTEENLRRLYLTEKKTAQQVADIIGCAKITVAEYARKFGIRKINRRK